MARARVASFHRFEKQQETKRVQPAGSSIYLMKYSIILHWERDRLLVLSVYGGGCHGSPIPEAPLNFKVPRTRVVQGPPRIVVALSIRNLDRSGTAWLVWDVSPIGKAKRMSIGGTAAQYCVG